MQRVSYRLFDGDIDPATMAHVEVNTGVVTEYGEQLVSGGYQTWNTAPYLERIYPLAEKIEAVKRVGGKVLRRRIVVIDDWEEV